MPRLSPPSSSWLHSLVPGSSPSSQSQPLSERGDSRERERQGEGFAKWDKFWAASQASLAASGLAVVAILWAGRVSDRGMSAEPHLTRGWSPVSRMSRCCWPHTWHAWQGCGDVTGMRWGWRLAEGLLQSIDLQQWDHAAEAEADPRPRLLQCCT